jgi:pantoate--beta-alanine ligase
MTQPSSEIVRSIMALRQRIAAFRAAGEGVGLVPTMGALHDGHLALIRAAAARHARVVVTIFVNPTQFGPREDFEHYPRTLEQDQKGLAEHGCDLLFAPDVQTVYPYGAAHTVRVDVPDLGGILEGAMRAGHFSGVATVVAKLFNLVQPDVAVFGQKDYQQLLVIRRLAHDLHFAVEILGAPTVREANGLAMSSRNQYLTLSERERAGVIYKTLCAMRDEYRGGKPRKVVENDARHALEQAGLRPDYAVLRRASDLAEPHEADRPPMVALIAAHFGRARLIDNLLLGDQ